MIVPANVVPLREATSGGSPGLSEGSDDDLCALARAGQQRAFDELVRRHQRAVVRVAARLLGDPQAARDAAQNAFVEVYRFLPRYQPQGQFRAFLFRVLRNQCLMHRRRETRHRLVEPLENHHTDGMPVMQPQGDEALHLSHQQRALDAAMEGMTEKMRSVLVLRFAGDCSLQEIADILELPVGTVKSRLFTALAELRQRLGDQAP